MGEETPHATGAAASATMRRFLLVINIIILAIGNCGGPLIMRLYFIHGGHRVWLSSCLETVGWPTILIPLAINYTRRCRSSNATTRPSLVLMNRRVFLAAAAIGVLTGVSNYLYAYGVSKLPVSTSSLIIATQLAFTAGFAFLVVRQRFTPTSINAVVLLTLGAVVLGIHANGDRPKGESNGEYFLGFFMTVGAAAIYGLSLPLVELTYAKAKVAMTYTLVLEVQLVLCFFATVFAILGMLINKDFQAIPREAMAYDLGETKYYIVLASNAIILQCFFLGAIGIVFYSSSLFSAIVFAVLLPITEVLAVLFYHEKFQAEKGISLFLSLWGFLSYLYGENQKQKADKTINDRNNPNHDLAVDEAQLARQSEGP